MTESSVKKHFGRMPAARMALEAGARVGQRSGHRLPASITTSFGIPQPQHLPEALASALAGVLATIDQLSRQIEEADAELEQMAHQKYPDMQYLRSINGVGTLTALSYLLTLSSPERFARSRKVGVYVGLRPTATSDECCA